MERIQGISLTKIKIDTAWNCADNYERLKMHNIHAYPAKFPAFIAKKAIEYAEEQGVMVNDIADVFCGCGTVGLEASLANKNFWGYDINPVAVLIAKVKSNRYNSRQLEKIFVNIKSKYHSLRKKNKDCYGKVNKRINYWYTKQSCNELYCLQKSILLSTKNGKYRDAFLCVFSSILKKSSRWLGKSIKPQIDPRKKDVCVFDVFEKQFKIFKNAVEERNQDIYDSGSTHSVCRANSLQIRRKNFVDLIITSPPYVTSYEYADLHQLSTLWLNYVEDYRELRKGAVGSASVGEGYSVIINRLNRKGQEIILQLEKTCRSSAKIKAIAKYYEDIQQVVIKCFAMLRAGGMAFFVIGDTEYKGVPIRNGEHLVLALREAGFTKIYGARRQISNKILTPYRDEIGKFTSDKSKRKIYHEEFIIVGRKEYE
ncbi:MAG: DNA methyltransferase [Phascolarctobacterium sp.]|nr:DNA methyltransferase [Phascolarctobacterium sp.]